MKKLSPYSVARDAYYWIIRTTSRLEDSLIRRSYHGRRMYRLVRRFLNLDLVLKRKRMAATLPVSQALAIPRTIGYRVYRAGELDIGEKAVVELARELVSKADLDASSHNNKEQLLRIDIPGEHLKPDSPFMRMALHRNLAAAMSAYLGEVPVLEDIFIWYSRYPIKATGGFLNSQLYHLDWDDSSMIKLFLLVEDVDSSSGPLCLVPADVSSRLARTIGYTFGTRLQDSDVESVYGPGVAITGSSGDLVAVDTCRCFHYGSRVADSDRSRTVVTMWYRLAGAFAMPIRRAAHSPFVFSAAQELDSLQKLVLGIA